MESLRLTTTFPVSPEEIYDAWITSAGHSAMTGSAATSTKKKGGAFTAWDGYIKGEHLELQPGRRILQAWRTTEFPKDAPDSVLELRLEPAPGGTRLVLLQGGIPNGQSEMYTEGWQEHYFAPMRKYFADKEAPARGSKQAAAERTPKSPPRGEKKAAPRRSPKPTPTPTRVKPPASASAKKAKAKAKATRSAPKKRTGGNVARPAASRAAAKTSRGDTRTRGRKKAR